MDLYTSTSRRARRTDLPFNPGRRHGNFAREMTLAEFRPRDGKALLQTDFVDRAPGQFPHPSPEARTR